jgi:Ca2+-binding RTX toxin-like protein
MARRLVYDLFHWLDNTVYGDDNVRGDEIRGGDGNDALFGLGGDDLLLGGDGNDRLFGGEGGRDELRGNAGDDTLFMEKGDKIFNGGDGTDTLDFSTYYLSLPFGIFEINEQDVGFKIDLSSGATSASTVSNHAFTVEYSTHSTFESIEKYRLTNQNDELRGDATADVIEGRGGDDLIEGRGGADKIFGDGGTNTASYQSSSQDVNVDLNRLGEQSGGDAAGDILRGIQNLTGSSRGDFLTGDGQQNRIEGGGGSDQITGGSGRDILLGGADADFFTYRFVTDSRGSFDQRDVIENFQRREIAPIQLIQPRVVGDTIDLHAVDANDNVGGNQDFEFIGNGSFTRAGQVRVSFQDNEGNPFTLVQAEVNGDGIADFALTVFTNDDTRLGASDFLL